MLILPRQNGKTDPLIRHLKALDAENAKLKEFASKLLVGACDRCPFNSCDECDVRETARKLGVEVRKP